MSVHECPHCQCDPAVPNLVRVGELVYVVEYMDGDEKRWAYSRRSPDHALEAVR